MTENKEANKGREPDKENVVIPLTKEWIYHRYLLSRDKLHHLLKTLSLEEYIALQQILNIGDENSIYGGRVYLHDLADKMQLSMKGTSTMVKKLQDRGCVAWSHDGDGSEGTYVTITETGVKLIRDHDEKVHKYFGNVIHRFGEENMMQLLNLMKQFEAVMSSEAEEEDGDD